MSRQVLICIIRSVTSELNLIDLSSLGYKFHNLKSSEVTPVFGKEHPIRPTSDVRTWWTSRPYEDFEKSHINFVVVDSKMEYFEASAINDCNAVESFVKNNHLGFAIMYNFQGVVSRYFPDFIIKMKTGEHLILETKGLDMEKEKKEHFLMNDVERLINMGALVDGNGVFRLM